MELFYTIILINDNSIVETSTAVKDKVLSGSVIVENLAKVIMNTEELVNRHMEVQKYIID